MLLFSPTDAVGNGGEPRIVGFMITTFQCEVSFDVKLLLIYRDKRIFESYGCEIFFGKKKNNHEDDNLWRCYQR